MYVFGDEDEARGEVGEEGDHDLLVGNARADVILVH
jgi:hypothetical protein